MNTYLIKVVFCPVSAYHQCVLDLAAGVGDTTGQGAGVILPLTGTVVVLVLVPVPVCVNSTATKLSKKKTRQCNTTGSKAKLHYYRFLIKCIIRSWEISLEKLKILLFSEYIIHNKVWHSRFYRITIWNKTAKSHNKVLA